MRECSTKAGPEEAKSQTPHKISPPREKSVLEALPWLSCFLIPGSKRALNMMPISSQMVMRAAGSPPRSKPGSPPARHSKMREGK